jgi:hypothetical protein
MIAVETETDLTCQTPTTGAAVEAIRAVVRRSDTALEVSFRLFADISRIRLKLPNSWEIGQLWRHTCFEVFVAIEGRMAYHEFNFAPSREWCVYAFGSYRNPTPLSNVIRPPSIAVRAVSEGLELDAHIVLSDLSEVHSRKPLRLGLSAVIESNDGLLSYWALNHPAGKPDFHRAEAFALRLEALHSAC